MGWLRSRHPRARACRMCDRRGKISLAPGPLPAAEREAAMWRITSSRRSRGSRRSPTKRCARCTCGGGGGRVSGGGGGAAGLAEAAAVVGLAAAVGLGYTLALSPTVHQL